MSRRDWPHPAGRAAERGDGERRGGHAARPGARRPPARRLLAVVVGFPAAVAVGYAAVHIPPSWGAFSQHYGSGTDAASWLCLAIAVVCSLALEVAGALTLNRRGVATSSSPLTSS